MTFILRGKYMAPAKDGGDGAKGSAKISTGELVERGGPEDLDEGSTKGDRGDTGTVKGKTRAEEIDAHSTVTGERAEELTAEEEEAAEEEETSTEETAEEETTEEEEAPAKKDEEDAEEEEVADDKKGARNLMVPKFRYDSVSKRLEAANARIGELEKGDAGATAAKADATAERVKVIDERLDKIDEEFAAAQGDNDQAKISKLRREERTLERERGELHSKSTAIATSVQAVESLRYDQTVEMLETEFTWLNPDDKTYNHEQAMEVRELSEAFQARGHKPAAALMKAMKYFADRETPLKDGAKKKAVVEPVKRKTDVVRNITTAKKTPPAMGKSGLDSNKAGAGGKPVNPAKLTDSELDALPEATKRRMRGDDM